MKTERLHIVSSLRGESKSACVIIVDEQNKEHRHGSVQEGNQWFLS